MTNVIKTEELTFTPKNDLTFTLHLIFNEEPTPSKVYLSANTEGCGFVVNETAINSLTDTIDCMTGDRIYLSPRSMEDAEKFTVSVFLFLYFLCFSL